VTAPTARYPFEVTLHQGAIEDIFLDSMAKHDVHVERPKTMINLEIDNDETVLACPESYPVRAVLKRLDKEDGDKEVVRAKYVIGADGAHSWVRKALGIEMEGEQTDFVWGVVDTIPDTNFPDIRNRTAIHSDNGGLMIIPREGDKVRLYVQIREDMDQTESNGNGNSNGRVNRGKWNAERIMEVQGCP
jgi:phenol 2-monooxygenase (NADPH)